jgi:hypothetical protein
MKKILFSVVMILALCYAGFAQDTVSYGNVTVWSEQGWIIKARNTGQAPATFKFTWVTEGRNQQGEVVNSITEESQAIKLSPNETRQLFTAPQDQQRLLTYVFKNFAIIEYKVETMQDLINEKQQARRRSTQ